MVSMQLRGMRLTLVGMVVFLKWSLLAGAAPFPFEYEWFMSGQPTASAEIFLDASSSAGGSLSDIGPGSFISTKQSGGPLNFMLSPFTPVLYDPVFTWNVSAITEIGLNFRATNANEIIIGTIEQNPNKDSSTTDFIDVTYFTVEANGDLQLSGEDIADGHWVSTALVAPDASNTSFLLFGGVTALALFRFFKNRTCPAH
jgi:hypothetical protein